MPFKGGPLAHEALGLILLLSSQCEGSGDPLTHKSSSLASRSSSMTSNTATWRRSHWTSQSGTTTSASPTITSVSAPHSQSKRPAPVRPRAMPGRGASPRANVTQGSRREDPSFLWASRHPHAKSGPTVLIWVQFGSSLGMPSDDETASHAGEIGS